ncbi:MAG TPA: NADH-quinone oxidoreductase subunit NuoK [Ardenticatenaceae bacterium]|nr:NADH-quinone oxidoreductase subunit NuoK [Ardenticatenaceae bacterium]
MASVPLSWYLVVAAVLFGIGLFGALARRNAVAILMGIELMMNAVNINLVAFWRYVEPANGLAGQMFAIMSITIAAAEVAVALALVLAMYRARDTVNLEEVDLLKW